jgi:hypothetical protein
MVWLATNYIGSTPARNAAQNQPGFKLLKMYSKAMIYSPSAFQVSFGVGYEYFRRRVLVFRNHGDAIAKVGNLKQI